MKVLSYFPYTTTIDGNEIVLRIKRMTMEEWFEFDARFTKVGSPTILRFAARCPEGPEQARDAKGQYRTSFEQILERRLEEMPPDRRAEYEKAVAADEIEAKEFMLDIFDRFVTVERGLTEETSDQKEVSVTAGKDVLRLFGARKDVLTCVLEAVRNENTLDARQKKPRACMAVPHLPRASQRNVGGNAR